MTVEDLAALVDELIEVLRLETRELEKLIVHVEQVTTRLPEENDISVIYSALSGIHLRLKKLRGVDSSSSS